ncbi:MAG: thiamine diphosphokinase [Pseudomonadota bacterium]
MIVDVLEPITLVGGANVSNALLLDTVARAPVVVAADSGADRALAAGVMPRAVIGDLDSLSAAGRAALPEAAIHHIPEQDSTDFDKALRNIAAPVVLGVGFLGDRLDHQLAVLHVLVKYPARAVVLLDDDSAVFLCPPVLSLPAEAGKVVSLFPLGPVSGTSKGLRWPIDGITMDPMQRVGTSNEATGPVTLRVDAPRLIVMVPRALLGAVTEALVSAPPAARWPSRA